MQNPLQSNSNCSSQLQISQNSQKSQTSITQCSQKRSKDVRLVSRKQIQQLNQRVRNQLQRNRKHYQTLITMNPYFSMKLYMPQNNFTSQHYNSSTITLMLKQLDMLLDDGHLLQKQIKKTEIRKMQSDYMNNYETDHCKHHYALIRKIWLNPNQNDAKNPLDRIQQLNKKVALVKNNLYTLIDIEKKSYQTLHNEDRYQTVVRKINEVVLQTKEYNILKEKYESLRMAYQDIQNKFFYLQNAMDQKIFQKNQIITKLKQQNQEYKFIVKQSKEKLLNSQFKEAKLLCKIKQLECDTRDRKLQYTNLQKQLTSQVNINKAVINIEDIKFRRIQVNQALWSQNQTIKDGINSQSRRQQNLLTGFQHIQNSQRKQINSFHSPLLRKQEENINSMNQDSTNDLSDAKSIDGRKGRFIRMRSPCGGRLNKAKQQEALRKNKQDLGSPKLKEIKGNGSKHLITSQS